MGSRSFSRCRRAGRTRRTKPCGDGCSYPPPPPSRAFFTYVRRDLVSTPLCASFFPLLYSLFGVFSFGRSVGCMVGPLVFWLVYWSVRWLVDRITDFVYFFLAYSFLPSFVLFVVMACFCLSSSSESYRRRAVYRSLLLVRDGPWWQRFWILAYAEIVYVEIACRRLRWREDGGLDGGRRGDWSGGAGAGGGR